MRHYRLHTEGGEEYQRNVERALGFYYEAFTITLAIGYYKGHKELSLTIDIYTDEDNLSLLKEIAESIAIMNKQESVAVVEVGHINVEFVKGNHAHTVAGLSV